MNVDDGLQARQFNGFLRLTFLMLSSVIFSGCVVKRTVTENGSVVAQGLVVKEPIVLVE